MIEAIPPTSHDALHHGLEEAKGGEREGEGEEEGRDGDFQFGCSLFIRGKRFVDCCQLRCKQGFEIAHPRL